MLRLALPQLEVRRAEGTVTILTVIGSPGRDTRLAAVL